MAAENFICATCGTQFPASEQPPVHCAICEDERQYVGHGGQKWLTRAELAAKHQIVLREQEPGLTGIGLEPSFGINQRALLVRTPQGNVLWDCISMIDDAAISALKQFGGLAAIAISHPHYYSAMVEWSHAFGGVPIHLHEADRAHVMRPDPVVKFWSGEMCEVLPGLTLVRTGGHFEGYQVMHWAAGAAGKGVMLTGDQPIVAMDRRWVSFMYSYPNLVPLNATAIRRIVAALEPFAYDRIYGAWWHSVVATDAQGAVRRSAERYLKAIMG
jgi:hypothetical protein